MKGFERVPKKVAFFGHFGMGNFGNESTLRAILHHARRSLPHAQFCCVATGPAEAAAIHGIEAIPIAETLVQSWRPRNRLARWMRKFTVAIASEIYRWIKTYLFLRHVDLFVVPGTGLLTDAYGLLEWGPYNLFRWCLVARLNRCKVLFVSVGAGPIYGAFAKWLTKRSLALADFRSFRDAASAQYLQSIGYPALRDPVYPDLAFSLPEAPVEDRTMRSSRRPVVGLGLMACAGRYSVPNPMEETNRNYLNTLSQVAGWLVRRQYDVDVMIGNFWDEPVRRQFKSLLNERLSEAQHERILEEPILCVEHLSTQTAAADLVVTTRFHSVILALLAKKPVIAISFHPKCASLMRAMGLSEYCLDINTLNAEDLIQKIRDLERNAGELKRCIEDKTTEFRKALEEQYKLIFPDCLGDAAEPVDAQKKMTSPKAPLWVSPPSARS